jgi:hypothetical protein
LLVIALPLIRGSETLVLRDILNSHLPMKWSQALALRAGSFPLIDPNRAGGQPLAGNPNAVPFYPDNLLYLAASPLWALNAHFWIHLLLAPWAFYALARAWGLGRGPSWAAAWTYTLSGFFLSQLNFYNLIAGAVLAPLFAASALFMVRSPRRLALLTPAFALLWALLLLGGDPQSALLALFLAATAAASVWRREVPPGERGRRLALFTLALACGTLLALPQLVEFLRILPLSFRGRHGYTVSAVMASSWDPRQTAEWFVPFFFGRPELFDLGSFWGQKFFTGVPPYYLSLYPGLLCLALVAASGRPRRGAAAWSWWMIACGLFFSLGKFNPVAQWLLLTVAQKTLRYPVKFWLLVAVGASLLCGTGFARLAAGEWVAVRRFRWGLALPGILLGAFWAVLTLAPHPVERWLTYLIPRKANFLANERLRWAGLCLLSLAILALLGLAFRLRRRSRTAAGLALLGVHAAAQLYLLAPLYPTDAVVPYGVLPPALAFVPANVPVASPDFNHLFGSSQLLYGRFPERHTRWLERRSAYELYPFTGPRWGRRYELNSSPEGLDSYFVRQAQTAFKDAKSADERLRMLAAWGVGRLLLNHPLRPLPAHARQLADIPSFGGHLYVYEVVDRAAEVFLAERTFREPALKEVFARLGDAAFDPRRDAALVGPRAGPEALPEIRGGGGARILSAAPEALEIETDAGTGGSLLVVQRADLLFEAIVDGQPVPVVTANGFRLGVEVPEGRHRVHLFVDRRPFHQAVAGAALGLLLLPLLAQRGRKAAAAALLR